MSNVDSKNCEIILDSKPTSPKSPIFILGIMPRSGTNFLFDLLQIHPECGRPGPISEDFLLRYVEPLIQYGQSVSSHWYHAWHVDAQLKRSLYGYLGSGLVSFLTSLCEKERLVTKTPSVENLQYYSEVFPLGHLIILVRDGRAVVESGIKSFGWSFETSVQKWTEAAQSILAFRESAQKTSLKYLIIKYEDLTDNVEEELTRILKFLDLDAQSYNFEAAANLPVRGSSIHRGKASSAVHWNPIEKPSDFHSKPRWEHWSRYQHERFSWLAGSSMQGLGYENVGGSASRWLWLLLNYSMDIMWPMRAFLEKHYKKTQWYLMYFKNAIKKKLNKTHDSPVNP